MLSNRKESTNNTKYKRRVKVIKDGEKLKSIEIKETYTNISIFNINIDSSLIRKFLLSLYIILSMIILKVQFTHYTSIEWPVLTIISFSSFSYFILYFYLKRKTPYDNKINKMAIKMKYPELSIVGLLLKKKEEESSKLLLAIFTISIIYEALCFFGYIELNLLSVLIPLFMMYIIVLNDKIMEYRIRIGRYGINEHEAREIIKFIVSNSNSIDHKVYQFLEC